MSHSNWVPKGSSKFPHQGRSTTAWGTKEYSPVGSRTARRRDMTFGLLVGRSAGKAYRKQGAGVYSGQKADIITGYRKGYAPGPRNIGSSSARAGAIKGFQHMTATTGAPGYSYKVRFWDESKHPRRPDGKFA